MGNAADAQSGLTQARERHTVDAKGRVIVHHDGRCIKMSVCVHRRVQARGKHRSLKRDVEAVSLRDGRVDVVIPVDTDHRAENLFAADLRVRRRIEQHRWLITAGADFFTAAHQCRPRRDRFAYPIVHAVGFRMPDQRPQVGRLVERVTNR